MNGVGPKLLTSLTTKAGYAEGSLNRSSLTEKMILKKSANAAELLITREKVSIISGAWGSSATLAVMPVMERNKVPLLVETSSSWKVTDPGTPGYAWVHRISPTSGIEAELAEPYLVKDLGMTKVSILSVNNDWGRGAAEVFTKAIERQVEK